MDILVLRALDSVGMFTDSLPSNWSIRHSINEDRSYSEKKYKLWMVTDLDVEMGYFPLMQVDKALYQLTHELHYVSFKWH
jgi:hypothetical protein